MNSVRPLIVMGILLAILALVAAAPAIRWYCRRTAKNVGRNIHPTKLGISTAAPLSGLDARTKQAKTSSKRMNGQGKRNKYHGAGRRMV